MSVDESAAHVPPAWSGIDLSRLPRDLAASLSRFMAETDAICAVGSELNGPQAEVVAEVLATGISRLSVAKAQALPVVDADGLWAVGGARSFPAWVAQRHRIGVHAARAEVKLARTLRDHLPATAAAATAGSITVEHAQVLAALAPTTDQRRDVLADPHNACNEQFLIGQAQSLPVDQLRVLVRQWAAYADPDADDRGYVEAADREHLEVSRLGDGYQLQGQLTVEHGQLLKTALAAVTPIPAAGDVRSAGQRRAQALGDLARLGLDHGLVGTGTAVRPRISVLVDHPTFTALAEAAESEGPREAATPTQPSLLGDAVNTRAVTRDRPTSTPPTVSRELLTGRAIAGGPQFEDATPIPRALLSRIACDSEIKRIIFGPESEILDVGRSARTFTRARRAAIIARDKQCRYPGCAAPPAISEGHHVRHWARDHGATSVDNGILLCWYHHDLVHRRHIEIHRRRSTWVFTDARGTEITADEIHQFSTG